MSPCTRRTDPIYNRCMICGQSGHCSASCTKGRGNAKVSGAGTASAELPGWQANGMMFENRLRKAEWEVRAAPLVEAQAMVREHHYARGGSNTAVYVHGLYRKVDDALCGVAWWLPPTRVACESVDKERWQKVLSLTRMVIVPGVPKNACSFLLARSVAAIRKDGRFVALVTYADESQGHTGGVYRAAGWDYVGRTGPYPRWLDCDGRQVAPKATKNRTKAEMEALGHRKVGAFYKHKYVLRLN